MSTSYAPERELIFVAKPEAGLRASVRGSLNYRYGYGFRCRVCFLFFWHSVPP